VKLTVLPSEVSDVEFLALFSTTITLWPWRPSNAAVSKPATPAPEIKKIRFSMRP
jgi:hypothetical protein